MMTAHILGCFQHEHSIINKITEINLYIPSSVVVGFVNFGEPPFSD